MQETTVARSYAEALIELALSDDDVELYDEDVSLIAELMQKEEEFRLFMETPRIEPAAKKQVIRRVFEGKIPSRLLRFLFIVIDKGRTRLLPSIAAEFSDLVDEHFERLKVEVTTATEPDEALRDYLRQRLGRLLGREVVPHFRIDPRIIGGVVVKVGDRVMDGSIRRRLQTLRRGLMTVEIG